MWIYKAFINEERERERKREEERGITSSFLKQFVRLTRANMYSNIFQAVVKLLLLKIFDFYIVFSDCCEE